MFRSFLLLCYLLEGAQAAAPFVTRSFAALSTQQPTTSTSTSSLLTTLLSVRGGDADIDVSDLVENSFGWAANLGAPAALVAGAVISTLYENLRSGDLELLETDSKRTRFAKKLAHTLLLMAFGLEMICIFVTTVTGTMLMSREMQVMDDVQPIVASTTPLSFLRGNFEFEYLTARVTMLQGILNWLSAIGLTHLVNSASKDLPQAQVYLNRFFGWSLFTCVALMLSFYNAHMTFYANYFEMLQRWFTVAWTRFVWKWPMRPLSVLFLPTTVLAIYWGFMAFYEKDKPKPKEFTVSWPPTTKEQ